MEIVLIALAALLVYGLDRNHHRQPEPRPRLAGRSDIEDRDLVRVAADLRTARPEPRERPTARTAARVRLAIGPR
ncbi:hypothetical protein [Actinokineospora sp.]|uniref:hypothetical protein n=1 Tax=Actinokineospora sp. TaxID=1872133 RepID=UPI003D6B1A0A